MGTYVTKKFQTKRAFGLVNQNSYVVMFGKTKFFIITYKSKKNATTLGSST